MTKTISSALALAVVAAAGCVEPAPGPAAPSGDTSGADVGPDPGGDAETVVDDTAVDAPARADLDGADGGCGPATCAGQCLPATGTCVDCTSDIHCGAAFVCQNNVCVPKGGCPWGASQCKGASALITCPDGKAWKVIACGGATVCDGGACVVPFCKAGQPACQDQVAGTCNATGTGLTSTTDCKATGKFCKEGACQAQVCQPGEPYCDGDAMAFCNDQGTGPIETVDCAVMGMVCLGDSCVKMPCSPGGVGCQGTLVVQCNGKNVQLIKDCGATGEGCDGGQCKPKICQPFETKCVNDTVFKTCNESGTAWSNEFDCGQKNGVCTPDGGCKPLPCPPGSNKGCEGTNLVQCNGAVIQVIENCAASGKVCAGGACTTPVCTPGATQCDGDVMQVCSPDGSGWTGMTPCDKMGMVCVGGQCQQAPCKPGEIGCAGSTVVQCNGPVPTEIEDCKAKGQTCDKGACVPFVCQPFTTECDGAVVMECNSKGTAWAPAEDCKNMGMACLAGKCSQAPCPPGGSGCSGSNVVLCDAAGGWSVVEACADSGAKCDNGACAPLTCAPNAGACDGAAAKSCNSDGSAWSGPTDCAKVGKSCDAGFCTSKPCIPDGVGCAGSSKVACPAGATGWQTSACGAGTTCSAGVCAPLACALPASLPAQAVRMLIFQPAQTAESCDLNGDGKADNALKSLALLASATFPQPASTQAQFVLAAGGWSTTGAPIDLQLLVGRAAAGSTCDGASGKTSCKVTIDPQSYDLSSKATKCPARASFAEAKVAAGKLSGGKGTAAIDLALTPAPLLTFVPVAAARVSGDVAGAPGWSGLAKGRLCGAIAPAALKTAASKLNPLIFEASGAGSVADVVKYIDSFKPDIDVDGDGIKESLSFAFRFVGAPVELVGVTP